MPLKQRVRVNKTLRRITQDLHLLRTRTRTKKKWKEEQLRNNFSNLCESKSYKKKSTNICKLNKCDQKYNLVNIHIHPTVCIASNIIFEGTFCKCYFIHLSCHIHCKVKTFGKEVNMQNIYPSNLIIKTRINQFS